MKKKALVIVCCIALLIGVAGTTLAWLTDTAGPAVNTFTIGDINITLDEAKVDEYGNFIKTVDGEETITDDLTEADRIPIDGDNGNTYKMIPGYTYTKDPTVTVLSDSEACWLFIKVTESGGEATVNNEEITLKDFIDYKVDTKEGKWQPLDANSYPGVYCIKVSAKEAKEGKSYTIIKDNLVTINSTVRKEMLRALSSDNYPKLVFDAYAVQLYKEKGVEFEAKEAWDEISKN